MPRCVISFDVGGTFTDFVYALDGQLSTFKVPSTPRDPSQAVIKGIRKVLEETKVSPGEVLALIHGTTVATNVLIEQKGSKTALFTTKGFRDVLEIGRQNRPKLYDLMQEKPPVLVKRRWRFELNERVKADGEIMWALNEEEVRDIIKKLKREGIESLAVCFIHSYIRPEHEQLVANICAHEAPDISVSLSSEICPQFREFERTSTTVINAYVMPRLKGYLRHLEDSVGAMGLNAARLNVMQSNGGIMTSQNAATRSVHTILSGPAGGVIGAIFVAGSAGFKNIISMDMGGTSCDVSLIENGEPKLTTETKINGYPVSIPMIEINTIGAGGGSIGWVDMGGALRVGPQSAGADPGPACYGLGGTEPTITDANLVLGRLNPGYFLGGEVRLDAALAYKAFAGISAKLNLDVEQVADAMVRIADANIVEAIKLISIEKGYDPRDFVLVAFGGAGPLHAAYVAKELEISKVFIPSFAGVLSALGLLVADVQHDYALTRVQEAANADLALINDVFDELTRQGQATLAREGIPKAACRYARFIDMRYLGQAYEVTVPVEGGTLDRDSLNRAVLKFHELHRQRYGYSAPAEDVELVTFRVVATGYIDKPTMPRMRVAACATGAIKEERMVFFDGRRIKTRVYDRLMLTPGSRIAGPAIVEEKQSTTLIAPGQKATVDEFGNIVIEVWG